MKKFTKPSQYVAYGKALELKLGLEELTNRYNDFRSSVGITHPVKKDTVRRFNAGKSGYENGVYKPYTAFLTATSKFE